MNLIPREHIDQGQIHAARISLDIKGIVVQLGMSTVLNIFHDSCPGYLKAFFYWHKYDAQGQLF